MNYNRTNPSWIRAKMEIKSLRFQKQFGQNFLIDGNITENIIGLLDLVPSDHVLEIGPGLGALTERLIGRAERVQAVEIDRFLAQELIHDFPELELITGDFLKLDLGQFPAGIKLVANLPYYITSAIIMHVLESELEFDRFVIMLQKEVAQRLIAEPGSKVYGVLSVITQLYCDVDYGFDVSARCFMPAPKVDSAVVRLWPKAKPPHGVIAVVKAAFSSRRKTLQNSLRNHYSPEQVSQALAQSGIDPMRRAETLNLSEFIALAEAMQ